MEEIVEDKDDEKEIEFYESLMEEQLKEVTKNYKNK